MSQESFSNNADDELHIGHLLEGTETPIDDTYEHEYKLFIEKFAYCVLIDYIHNLGSKATIARTIRTDKIVIDVSAELKPIAITGGSAMSNITLSVSEVLPYYGEAPFDYMLCEDQLTSTRKGFDLQTNWYLVNDADEVTVTLDVETQPKKAPGDVSVFAKKSSLRELGLEDHKPSPTVERLDAIKRNCEIVFDSLSEDSD
jgi:hypothetical protein